MQYASQCRYTWQPLQSDAARNLPPLPRQEWAGPRQSEQELAAHTGCCGRGGVSGREPRVQAFATACKRGEGAGKRAGNPEHPPLAAEPATPQGKRHRPPQPRRVMQRSGPCAAHGMTLSGCVHPTLPPTRYSVRLLQLRVKIDTAETHTLSQEQGIEESRAPSEHRQQLALPVVVVQRKKAADVLVVAP